jgi:hypothetical protein
MKTLANPETLARTSERLENLRPDSVRRWGAMTAAEMLCHLSDIFHAALGDRALPASARSRNRWALKWVALYTPIPWPHGYPTRPEFDSKRGGTPPGAFDRDRAAAIELLRRFAASPPGANGLPHPLFGRMSARHWLRWGYLHTDHHLRQFGV